MVTKFFVINSIITCITWGSTHHHSLVSNIWGGALKRKIKLRIIVFDGNVYLIFR